MSNRVIIRLLAIVGLGFASVSCGDVSRSGRSPMFLMVDLLQAKTGHNGELGGTLASDVITNVTSPAPCTATTPCPTVFNDIGQVTLRTTPKDIGTTDTPASPTTNNEVTITRYHVQYRRADGRNVAGVDVPYGFDGGVTGTIQAGATKDLAFEIVRVVSKEESPLVQLRPSGCPSNPSSCGSSNGFIDVIADVTFYGQDQVGNEINATGSISIDFGNFGDF